MEEKQKESNSHFVLISIVAIIAIVSIVIVILTSTMKTQAGNAYQTAAPMLEDQPPTSGSTLSLRYFDCFDSKNNKQIKGSCETSGPYGDTPSCQSLMDKYPNTCRFEKSKI